MHPHALRYRAEILVQFLGCFFIVNVKHSNSNLHVDIPFLFWLSCVDFDVHAELTWVTQDLIGACDKFRQKLLNTL